MYPTYKLVKKGETGPPDKEPIANNRHHETPTMKDTTMKRYRISFYNIAYYVTFEVAGDSMEYAESVAKRIKAALDDKGIAQEEYEMQSGHEPETYEREAFDYKLDFIEEDGTVEGEDARKLRTATEAVDLRYLQVDAGGHR